jgi:hypothetical protein
MLDGRLMEVEAIDELVSLIDENGKRVLRPFQIAHFTAPPRSGKSTLLKALEDRYMSSTPVGTYSFRHMGTDPASSDGPLDLLMDMLSSPRKVFGELTFPRLQSTRVATSEKTDPPSPIEQNLRARARYYAELLEDQRRVDLVNQIIDKAVNDAGKIIPTGMPGTETATFAIQRATLASMRHTQWGRKRLSPLAKSGLGPWAGMIKGPQNLDLSGMEAVYYTLACITTFRNSNQKALVEQAEAQPWLAFLADIQAGYTSTKRTTRAILLLDDVDLPAGTRFLDALSHAAAEHERHRFGVAPLLVIAMGRHQLTRAHSFFKAQSLADLSRAEVRDIIRRWDGIPGRSAAEDAVPVLSAGHRGIAEDMLSLCAAEKTYPFDLTCGLQLRGRLLSNVDDGDFAALVTAAPAIEVGQVELADLDAEAKGLPLSSGQRTNVRRILQEHGWLRPQGVVHPAIRNVLLRRLADDGSAWQLACLRLRAHPPDIMRPDGRTPFASPYASLDKREVRNAANRAYYELASGNVAAAVACLEDIRSTEDEELWIAAFDWVTSAPQPYGVHLKPRELAAGLVGHWLGTAPGDTPPAAIEAASLAPPYMLAPAHAVSVRAGADADPIRRRLLELIVPCWLGADRQLDPFHDLDQDIADAYRKARPLGAGIFVERGEFFNEEARKWRRDDHDHHPRPRGVRTACQG